RLTWRHIFRLAWHFGLFQFLMPIAGWAAGETVAARIGQWDHWIAFGLLAFIGGRMIFSSLKPGGGECACTGISDPTCGITLVSLSVATSLDALAVGFSLAAIGVGVLYPAAVIGLVAAILTTAGMYLGRALGAAFGRRVGAVGGLVLVGVGIKILSDHLAR
ncbi:MAG: manganese efflux pump MntP family protein, partial [Planctomycetota bacterium]|nr:manganese efflux pump MntP family protein [Planctomycetota bacterium]